MARQLQLRRGTTEESTSFIGALGEVTVDTSNYKLRVHDGMTPGGHIVGEHTVVVNTDDLFDWKWSDHRLSEDQDKWVCADDYEWVYADNYPDAYQHLVDDTLNPIYYSNWKSSFNEELQHLGGEIYSLTWDGTQYIIAGAGYALGSNWSSRFATSTDGKTWVDKSGVFLFNGSDLPWNNTPKFLKYVNNLYFCVTHPSGEYQLYTSTDGVNYTQRTIDNYQWVSICFDGSNYIAISSDGYISTSSDGTTWSAATQPEELSPETLLQQETWIKCIYANSKLYLIGSTYIAVKESNTWVVSFNMITGSKYWDGYRFINVYRNYNTPNLMKISTSADCFVWGAETEYEYDKVYLGCLEYVNNRLMRIPSTLYTTSSYAGYVFTSELGMIEGTSTPYIPGSDGHKIVTADDETLISNLYNSVGVAWYYVLDTENQRFKLPRTKWGVVGLRDQVEGYVKQDVKLPNITGSVSAARQKYDAFPDVKTGVFVDSTINGQNSGFSGDRDNTGEVLINFDASNSSSVYSGNGTDTLIQPRATQMYLYFCLKPMETEIGPSEGSDVCKAIENQNNALGSEPILYNWEGTLQEYLDQDVEHLHPEWVCYITDDVVDTTQNPAYYVHRIGDEIIQGYKTFINTIYAEGGIQGTSSSAKWADLAERYQSDSRYPIGTLVKFGGEKDITIADTECQAIISDKPGFILDSELDDSLPIALSGKTPVRVLGKVNKFDKLVLSNEPGVAKVQETSSETVIAIALESSLLEEEKLVLSVVKLTF